MYASAKRLEDVVCVDPVCMEVMNRFKEQRGLSITETCHVVMRGVHDASQQWAVEHELTLHEILLATIPSTTTTGTPAAAAVSLSPLHSRISEQVPMQMLVNCFLVVMLASAPQGFVRSVTHQLDRCPGTNISQYVHT